MNEQGTPNITQRAWVVPPVSQLGPIDPAQLQQLLKNSLVAGVYEQLLDRESAFERLNQRSSAASTQTIATQTTLAGSQDQSSAKPTKPAKEPESLLTAFAKTAIKAVGTQVGREIVRGVLGSVFGRRR